MLNIEKRISGTEMTLALTGRLDIITAPELNTVIKSDLNGITVLNIDMKSLEYLSSAGLRVLLSAQKIMNEQGKMKVTNVGRIVMEIFEVTGVCDIFTIE